MKIAYNETSNFMLEIKKHTDKPWISEMTLGLISRRRNIRDKLLTNPDDEEAKEEHKYFNKSIKNSCRRDKRLYLMIWQQRRGSLPGRTE